MLGCKEEVVEKIFEFFEKYYFVFLEKFFEKKELIVVI